MQMFNSPKTVFIPFCIIDLFLFVTLAFSHSFAGGVGQKRCKNSSGWVPSSVCLYGCSYQCRSWVPVTPLKNPMLEDGSYYVKPVCRNMGTKIFFPSLYIEVERKSLYGRQYVV